MTVDERKANADILVEYASGGNFTIKLQKAIELGSKRGIKRHCENGMIEVTERKLTQLRKIYDVQSNF